MTAPSLIFTTELLVSLDHGSQTELSLAVTYDYHPGSPGSRDEPATGDAIDITDLVLTGSGSSERLYAPPWLRDIIGGDASLLNSLLENARDEASHAAALALEMRAEAAREDRADQPHQYGRLTGYESD